MSENPYQVVGTRFTPQEFELVQMGLTEVASQAKHHGETDVFQRTMDLLQRLQHYVIAGKGIPPELDQQFADKFKQAVVDGNGKSTIVTMRKWIAARIRLEPDPAKAVSHLVTRIMFGVMQGQQNLAAAGVLAHVEKKLSALKERYDWPSGVDALKYVETWVAHGRTNLENDQAPWVGDADLGE